MEPKERAARAILRQRIENTAPGAFLTPSVPYLQIDRAASKRGRLLRYGNAATPQTYNRYRSRDYCPCVHCPNGHGTLTSTKWHKRAVRIVRIRNESILFGEFPLGCRLSAPLIGLNVAWPYACRTILFDALRRLCRIKIQLSTVGWRGVAALASCAEVLLATVRMASARKVQTSTSIDA